MPQTSAHTITFQPATAGPQVAVQIATGYDTSFAMMESGQIYAWGDGSQYTGGFGTADRDVSTGLTGTGGFGISPDQRLSAGDGKHMMVIQPDGTVTAAGYNDHAQIGDNSAVGKTAAGAIPALGADIIEISRGPHHSMFIRAVARRIVPPVILDPRVCCSVLCQEEAYTVPYNTTDCYGKVQCDTVSGCTSCRDNCEGICGASLCEDVDSDFMVGLQQAALTNMQGCNMGC